ncbi:MAG: hypothetical protein BGN85_08890 [Alphaproteobacteria bacterium 64-11]|nr:MAG: hypothetical protein BGN85_08890 [Alphaproteobacteria bacterium 64-11]
MAEVKTVPVKAQRFDDIDDVDKQSGAFKYFKAGDRYPAGMIYSCPCGCGARGALRFRPAEPAHPSWEWDGNMEAPTLSPSVHHVGHWHGWLQGGVWKSC